MGRAEAFNKFHTEPLGDDADLQAKVGQFFIRNALLIVSVIIALVMIGVMNSTISSRQAELDDLESTILSKEASLKDKEKEVRDDRGTAIMSATGGYDPSKKREEDNQMDQFFKKVFTWESLSEYKTVRDDIMKQYHLAEDSQFMRTFMPGEIEGVMRTDPSGKTHYAFDEGLSSTYESFDSYVTDISGDVYSYQAVVAARTDSDSKQVSQVFYSLINYDVVNGEIKNLNGVTVPGGIEKSG